MFVPLDFCYFEPSQAFWTFVQTAIHRGESFQTPCHGVDGLLLREGLFVFLVAIETPFIDEIVLHYRALCWLVVCVRSERHGIPFGAKKNIGCCALARRYAIVILFEWIFASRCIFARREAFDR